MCNRVRGETGKSEQKYWAASTRYGCFSCCIYCGSFHDSQIANGKKRHGGVPGRDM